METLFLKSLDEEQLLELMTKCEMHRSVLSLICNWLDQLIKRKTALDSRQITKEEYEEYIEEIKNDLSSEISHALFYYMFQSSGTSGELLSKLEAVNLFEFPEEGLEKAWTEFLKKNHFSKKKYESLSKNDSTKTFLEREFAEWVAKQGLVLPESKDTLMEILLALKKERQKMVEEKKQLNAHYHRMIRI